MKLLTKELLKRFKEVGRQDRIEPIIICKFFAPDCTTVWYASEFNLKTKTFYGYIFYNIGKSFEFEGDEFALGDLQALKGISSKGLYVPLKRDLNFKEKNLLDVYKEELKKIR